MLGLASEKSSSGQGGLFLRLILPLVVLTLGAAFFSLVTARRAEDERNRERISAIAESNARLCQKLRLPRTARLAGDLSTTAGVTILFSGRQRELISAVPLTEEQRALAWQALEDPGSISQKGAHQAVASRVSAASGESLIALHEVPRGGFFDKSTLTPSLVSGLILALGAAFFISRSVVVPLRKMARETRATPDDRPLDLPPGLLKRRDEIGRLARELVDHRLRFLSEQEKRRSVERLALLGQITTSLAHEIKNPAASIIMQARQLESGDARPTGQLIREEGERIASLVDQWLFVARPKGAQTQAHDLSAQWRRLLETMKPLMEYHRVKAELTAPGALIIQADGKRLEHVFRNLLDNALQAMPHGGLVRVRLEDLGDTVGFSISDEGEGFSEEALAHFGEAFYSEREGGFGLGLTLVCGVMEAHHGEIEVKNLPDGGGLVTGTLPKTQPRDLK
jgi:signal transduction histidine kinase